MARYRLSDPAKADLRDILTASEREWGIQARLRYRALLTTAMRHIAAAPDGILTCNRSDLFPGLRSFALHHCRHDSPEGLVRNPAHILYYRVAPSGVIEIIRVLHLRAEPARHVAVLRNQGPSDRVDD